MRRDIRAVAYTSGPSLSLPVNAAYVKLRAALPVDDLLSGDLQAAASPLAELGELVAGLLLLVETRPDGAPRWHKQALRSGRPVSGDDAQVSKPGRSPPGVINNGKLLRTVEAPAEELSLGCSIGPVSQSLPDASGVPVVGAGHPLVGGQQGGVLVARSGCIPRLPSEASERLPDAKGVGVVDAEHPLEGGQHRSVLVAGPGRISHLPSPGGEAGAMAHDGGLSAPDTRSISGSSVASWSRAPAASPICPVQLARLARRDRTTGSSAPHVRS
jgi:hypothetical protein